MFSSAVSVCLMESYEQTVNVAETGNQLSKVHMDYTVNTAGCRADTKCHMECRWWAHLGVFFTKRPTIILCPFWASNYRHLENVWIIFISTVIHLYVYATHITWKYVGFCHKDQTSLSKIQKCTLRFKISPAVSSKRQQKPLLSWEQITKKTM